MGFIQFLKEKRAKEKAAPASDAKHNPYQEKLLHTTRIVLEGGIDLIIREIRNQQAQVMGAQAVLEFRGEKAPVIISSPRSDSFSAGINIAMPKEVMSEFKQELRELQAQGIASSAAKLSYNPDTKNAILFRRSDTKINGNLQRWRSVVDANIQTLVDDFMACLPFVMKVYGE